MLERAGHSNISAVPHTTQCSHNQPYSCIFRPQLSVASAGLLAPVLLVISMLMATPLFFHTQLDDFKINVDNPNYHVYCVEKWSQNSTVEEGIERTYYTYFSMAMQYVVPFVIMASIYLKIFYYLKTYRLFWMGVIRDSSINQKATTSLVVFFSFCTSFTCLENLNTVREHFRTEKVQHTEIQTLHWQNYASLSFKITCKLIQDCASRETWR